MNSKVLNSQLVVTLAGVAATGALIYWLMNRGGAVLAAVGDKMNPASSSNLIYDDVVGGLGRTLSGNDNWDLGVNVYDLFNSDDLGGKYSFEWFNYPVDSIGPVDDVMRYVAYGGGWDYVNPASDKNLISTGTNYAIGKATGNENFNLGRWIYDLFN